MSFASRESSAFEVSEGTTWFDLSELVADHENRLEKYGYNPAAMLANLERTRLQVQALSLKKSQNLPATNDAIRYVKHAVTMCMKTSRPEETVPAEEVVVTETLDFHATQNGNADVIAAGSAGEAA